MNGSAICWLGRSLFVALLTMSAFGQLVVDATVPIRGRLRNPTAGTSGSIGRKLAMQIAIETTRTSPNDSWRAEVDFILKNTGKVVLTLPLSPHPGDLEPANARYSVEVLSLYVTSGKRQDSLLSGRTSLYGSRVSPETLVKLAPGESIRVLTRIGVPQDSAGTADQVFVGHASLEHQTVKTTNGQTIDNTREVGSASSSDRTP